MQIPIFHFYSQTRANANVKAQEDTYSARLALSFVGWTNYNYSVYDESPKNIWSKNDTACHPWKNVAIIPMPSRMIQ